MYYGKLEKLTEQSLLKLNSEYTDVVPSPSPTTSYFTDFSRDSLPVSTPTPQHNLESQNDQLGTFIGTSAYSLEDFILIKNYYLINNLWFFYLN